MPIYNNKGKVFTLSGPSKEQGNYWDLSKLKYFNFDKYGDKAVLDINLKEIPVKEIISPNKKEEDFHISDSDFKSESVSVEEKKEDIEPLEQFQDVGFSLDGLDIVEEKKEIQLEEKEKFEYEEDDFIDNIDNQAGTPIIYFDDKGGFRYQIYALAIDFNSGCFYFKNREFEELWPKKEDRIYCEWDEKFYKINNIKKIKNEMFKIYTSR